MNIISSFIAEYGTTILYTLLTALAGVVATWIKSAYTKYINNQTKKDVVKTCVTAGEQLYKDLHGDDKYNAVVANISEILSEKGITITTFEIKMLVESTLGEFNKVFATETDNINITDAELSV